MGHSPGSPSKLSEKLDVERLNSVVSSSIVKWDD
jgi:hypothetical protein